MSGQCFGCGAEFSRFKKERGCKNCGFAFCNKCLHENSIPVPKKNNAKHHVCFKCFKILTGAVQQSTEEQKVDPPEAYLKRIAALKEKEAAGQSSRPAGPRGGKPIPEHLLRLDKADRDIAMRLEKLREVDKPSEKVSEADLRRRLAQLKGQSDVQETKPVYKPPENKSETQQVDDLMEQLISEVDIDSLRPDPAQDVADRLARLQQSDRAKSAIDKNNLSNTLYMPAADGNDLNKVDKMGSLVRGPGQDGANIKMARPGPSSGEAEELDVEEVQRLMLQAGREAELDARRAMAGIQQDTELMDRLRQLQKQRAERVSADSDTADSDADNTAQTEHAAVSDDESVSSDQIVQQYVAEAKIDQSAKGSDVKRDWPSGVPSSTEKKAARRKKSQPADPTPVELKPSNVQPALKEDLADSDYDDADELPYCCMCTEDAAVRCTDCDMDLYCRQCFRACHEEMAITDHRTTPYKAPKGYR